MSIFNSVHIIYYICDCLSIRDINSLKIVNKSINKYINQYSYNYINSRSKTPLRYVDFVCGTYLYNIYITTAVVDAYKYALVNINHKQFKTIHSTICNRLPIMMDISTIQDFNYDNMKLCIDYVRSRKLRLVIDIKIFSCGIKKLLLFDDIYLGKTFVFVKESQNINSIIPLSQTIETFKHNLYHSTSDHWQTVLFTDADDDLVNYLNANGYIMCTSKRSLVEKFIIDENAEKLKDIMPKCISYSVKQNLLELAVSIKMKLVINDMFQNIKYHIPNYTGFCTNLNTESNPPQQIDNIFNSYYSYDLIHEILCENINLYSIENLSYILSKAVMISQHKLFIKIFHFIILQFKNVINLWFASDFNIDNMNYCKRYAAATKNCQIILNLNIFKVPQLSKHKILNSDVFTFPHNYNKPFYSTSESIKNLRILHYVHEDLNYCKVTKDSIIEVVTDIEVFKYYLNSSNRENANKTILNAHDTFLHYLLQNRYFNEDTLFSRLSMIYIPEEFYKLYDMISVKYQTKKRISDCSKIPFILVKLFTYFQKKERYLMSNAIYNRYFPKNNKRTKIETEN